MQVMFHLLPRLQAVQEQRAALGAIGPDLDSTTRFAALVPDALLDPAGNSHFHLFQPPDGLRLPPFYIERTLAKLDETETRGLPLTAAERRSVALLRATASHLQPLTFNASDRADDLSFSTPANGVDWGKQRDRRATRADLFSASLTHSDAVARLLEMHLLDPIRHDLLDPDDPFVQTTLYVVAPFFDPLATAPVWPAVAQLLQRAGRRHLSQVVGIFATGSYAMDGTRALEDAVTYAALRELELLTGLRTESQAGQLALVKETVERSGSTLGGQVGEPLFDFTYLLDREKSNQSLADDSHELAILAGNALEAMIVASGNLYVQEQLGLGVYGGEPRPYSLIGAATDYVPVSQVLHAVNRQEESRLVRDWVLRSTSTPRQGSPLKSRPAAPTMTSLSSLGLRIEDALAALVVRHPEMYENSHPQTIDEMVVRRSYILPDSLAKAVRRTSGSRWRLTFRAHLSELSEHLALAAGPAAVDSTWGTEAAIPADSHSVDDRIFPQATGQIQQQLTQLVVAEPAGLIAAEQQVARWQSEAEQERLRLLTRATPSSRKLLDIRQEQAHRDWSAAYVRAVQQKPALWATLARALGAITAVILLALVYMWLADAVWVWRTDGLALAGFAMGSLLAALSAYGVRATRVQRLSQVRVSLAQEKFTGRLQNNVTDGLLRLYDGVLDLLNDWSVMLAEAKEELRNLSTPPVMPAVPPPDVPLNYLYDPHLHETVWDRCLTYLHEQIDADGQRSEDRLDHLWGQPEWRHAMQRLLRNRAGQGNRDNRAQTIARFIRETVRKSVAPISLDRLQPARLDLMRDLAQSYNIEQMLWRFDTDERDLQSRVRALNGGYLPPAQIAESGKQLPKRRYIEMAWNRAKPTANYDVSDRLAVYGVAVDFVAASGSPDSDLARILRDEFNLMLLPTQDPFSNTVVRTVHGLTLEDLDCMRRYRAELTYLLPQERALIRLINDPVDLVQSKQEQTAQRNEMA